MAAKKTTPAKPAKKVYVWSTCDEYIGQDEFASIEEVVKNIQSCIDDGDVSISENFEIYERVATFRAIPTLTEVK